MDQAINAANVARSDVGARITVLEDIDRFRTDQKVVAQEMLSTLRDTNYAESVAKLQAQMTALQVAQQAYGRATSRTLFDYL
jgi:flagellar hook-associated protein 3 FlgL